MAHRPTMGFDTGEELVCRYSWTRFLPYAGGPVIVGVVICLLFRSWSSLWAIPVACLFAVVVLVEPVLHFAAAIQAPKRIIVTSNALTVHWEARSESFPLSHIRLQKRRLFRLTAAPAVKLEGRGQSFLIFENISNFQALVAALEVDARTATNEHQTD